MSTNNYPNRDTLRKANDIYLDVMRPFIIHHLKQVKGETVENLIEYALNDNQVDWYLQMLDDHNDVESAIDFNFIPQIIKYHWDVFSQKFNGDLAEQSMLWLIRKGRNGCEHIGKNDLDSEFTRTRLYLIATILENINRPDKQSEIEKIRDHFLSDDAEKKISDISISLKTTEAEKKGYKNDLSNSKKRIEELEKEQTGYKERIKILENVETENSKIKERLDSVSKDLKAAEAAWSEAEKSLKTKKNQLKGMTVLPSEI